MSINLLGEEYDTLSEYSKKIIEIKSQKPIYYVKINNVKYYPNSGLNISLIDINKNEVLKSGLNISGIYSIWNGIPEKSNCLYVGGTNFSISSRIYRFMKELLNLSRRDENHPAAKKCRYSGQNPYNIYVKYISRAEFPIIINNPIIMNEIKLELIVDEYVAKLLNAKHNKKVKV